jgi:hypothetical protein
MCIMFIIVAICGFQSNSQISGAVFKVLPAADRMVAKASILARKSLTTAMDIPKAEDDSTAMSFFDEAAMLRIMSERSDAIKAYENQALWDASLIKLTTAIDNLVDQYTEFWGKVDISDATGDQVRVNAKSYSNGM